MDISSVKFPPVTGFLLASTAVVTLPVLLGWSFWRIDLDWRGVLSGAVWTPFTAFFFGGAGFPLLFDFFNLYRTSMALEQGHLDTAAYSWTVLILSITILAVNELPIFRFGILFRALLSALLYLWSRANPTAKVSIFGLISLPTRLYPFALMVLDLVQSGPPAAMRSFMGIIVGHFWWFVTTYLPFDAPPHLRRPNPFVVPAWFRNLFQRSATAYTASSRPKEGTVAPGVSVRDNRPAFANANAAVRHRWGSGQRLGDQ